MAGAAIAHVGVSLFVAGAAFDESWVDSRSARRCRRKFRSLTSDNMGS